MDFSKNSTRFSVQGVKWRYPWRRWWAARSLGYGCCRIFFWKKM